MKILVSNAGSTSLKFKLFEMDGERALCDARVERVGQGFEKILPDSLFPHLHDGL